MDASKKWPRTIAVGELTFANVDGPDDRWRWSIVRGYRDCQSYDEDVLAFAEEDMLLPTEEQVRTILYALQAPELCCGIEMLTTCPKCGSYPSAVDVKELS